MKPTPDEIEKTILSMAGLVGSSYEKSDQSYTPLWWVSAYDAQGNLRGIGSDATLGGALAGAWILSHEETAKRFLEAEYLDVRDFDCVPRHVPDDWAFEIDNMPTAGSG